MTESPVSPFGRWRSDENDLCEKCDGMGWLDGEPGNPDCPACGGDGVAHVPHHPAHQPRRQQMSEPEPVAWVMHRDNYGNLTVAWSVNEAEPESGLPLFTHAQLTAATTAARAEGAREALEGAAVWIDGEVSDWQERADRNGPNQGMFAGQVYGGQTASMYLRHRAAQLGQDADRG